METPELSAAHIQLLGVIYEGFRDRGEWPTTSFVDAVLDKDHNLDVDSVLADMPPGVAVVNGGYTEHSETRATVLGLSYLAEASQDLGNFVALIRVAADRERDARPGPREVSQIELTSADSDAIWGQQLSAEELVRVFEILTAEGVSAGARRQPDGDWSLDFNRNVRRYRDVTDVADFIARRPDTTGPAWGPPPRTEPYVFVLMPFQEGWSRNVHDEIDQACREIAGRFEGLKWERADDITEPGRITDQIVSAIERADVIVADITATNANVLFELGYADALDKPIIVLNQDVEQTPFDIKDWRQVLYSTDELRALRGSLVNFLEGSLRRVGFSPQI
ncbi:MAG TPA: nucleoside 2-deoxyribosyltransferase [Solirubrobacteraceae bacterium]|jgi:hypothetical protein|nr:nucleoside 2-deoxyribosyltransferase [Solirubrobacteraceae bacterium]